MKYLTICNAYSCNKFNMYIDICFEKIRGPGSMYGGIMHGQGFGADMSTR